jgi:hypothetical protein
MPSRPGTPARRRQRHTPVLRTPCSSITTTGQRILCAQATWSSTPPSAAGSGCATCVYKKAWTT